MPPEIEALINQINRELDVLETEANQGVELAQTFLRQFPDNPYMNQQPFTPEQEIELEKLLQLAEQSEQNLKELLEYGEKMLARHHQERQKTKTH